MEHEIDVNTGLPVPPIPGTYWEVRKFCAGDVFPATGDKDERLVDTLDAGYYVLLCMEDWSEASVRIRRNPKAHFWNSEPKEITETISPKRTVYVLHRKRCGITSTILEDWQVLSAAKSVCTDIALDKERARAAQRLLGKYPPNKLG